MKLINSGFQFKQDFAQIISDIIQPLLVTIPIFIIVNYSTTSGINFFILTLLCLIFATFLPFTAILMWIKRKNLDLDVSDKNERGFPLFFGVISYLIGVIMLYAIGAPAVATVLMFCYFSSTLLTIIITYFWKISVHSMGIAGPTAAMIYIFGYPGLIFGFPLLMVMWSRIHLNHHTLSQVVVGAFAGFLFTWAQFNILIA